MLWSETYYDNLVRLQLPISRLDLVVVADEIRSPSCAAAMPFCAFLDEWWLLMTSFVTFLDIHVIAFVSSDKICHFFIVEHSPIRICYEVGATVQTMPTKKTICQYRSSNTF